jgi:hypothetical protein
MRRTVQHSLGKDQADECHSESEGKSVGKAFDANYLLSLLAKLVSDEGHHPPVGKGLINKLNAVNSGRVKKR